MKKILFPFIYIIFITLNCFSQAQVSWTWKNNLNRSFDVEYKNGYLYTFTNFNEPTLTLGANTFINNGENDMVIAKLDTFGNIIWANSYGGHGNDFINSMTLDNNGNIYVTGQFTDTLIAGNNTLIPVAGNADIFMLKLNNNGTPVLARQTGSVNNDIGQDIAADNNGNIYIISNSGGITFAGLTSPANAKTVIKYDNTGNEKKIRWLTGTGGAWLTPSTFYQVISIVYSESDNTLVFGGMFDDGAIGYSGGGSVSNMGINNQDIFLIKIDTTLTGIYTQNITGNYSKTNILLDMCAGDNGNIYCAQWFGYTLNGFSYNSWNEYDTYLSQTGFINAVSTALEYTPGDLQKIFYDDNILYGIIRQPQGPSYCTDHYAMKWNINNNTTSYMLLNSWGGVAGHNGNYYLGINGIGKACEANCNYPLTINPTPDVSYCTGGFAEIGKGCFYAEGGNPAYSYSWSPAAGLNDPNIANPFVSGITGTVSYTLTVTDLNNNIVRDTVAVTADTALTPVNISSQYPSFCDSMKLYSNNGIAGNWYRFMPLNLPNNQWQFIANDTTITIYTAGKYRYEKSNSCNTVRDTIDIAGSLTVTANATQDSVCAGQSVTLTGSGAATYTWTGGVTNNIPFNPVTTQTYIVTGTDGSGCSNTSYITVTINNSNIVTNTTICQPQLPYTWNGQTINNAGTYTATFTNMYGCDSVETLNLTVSPCIICVPNFTINYSPYYYALTESQSWITTSGTVLIPSGVTVKLDANSASYVRLNPGFKAEYGAVFIAQAYNGCTPGAPQLPQVGKIANADVFVSSEIVLYPNPTSGMIHIKHDEKLKNIQIFDMVGKLVVNQSCEGEPETNIDLSNLPNGVYHVKAAGYNSIKVVKNN